MRSLQASRKKIADTLIVHLSDNKQISKNQFAYLPDRSNQMQLLKFTNKIITTVGDEGQLDTAFLDFYRQCRSQ